MNRRRPVQTEAVQSARGKEVAMELRQLLYFITCARCGSLTTAAEELFTTQPHVSMVIRELEKELGTRLFLRRSNGVELTEAGSRVYGYAQDALRNAELFRSVGREQREHSLRVLTNNSSNMAVMLTAFYNERTQGDAGTPSLYMQFTECGIEKMIEFISGNEYDLGFLFVPDTKRSALRYLIDRRQLTFTPLLDTDLVLYVGKNHPLASRDFVTPEELATLSFIQLEDDFFTVEDLLTGSPAFRRQTLAIRRVVRTNSDHMMIRMLEKTELCNLGSYWLRDAYRQYDFRRIPVEGMEGRIAFGYISRKSESFDADTADFLDFLRRTIQSDAVGQN
ncbi:MAG: LysR family transcriptional regulator [Acidaminococcaceae bacterium]|nr:LysR family transcriptional regulator [Acidaminococcaceae bacterium]